MSEHSTTLALAFLKTHPHAAAQILEHTEKQEAANFICGIPAEYRTPVLEAMLPQYAAIICKVLSAEFIASLLIPMNTNAASSILRYMNKKQRVSILNQLPPKIKTRCNQLLRFSRDTIGAWMSPQVATTALTNNCGQTKSALTVDDCDNNTDCIFVLDSNHQFRGRLYYTDLIQADNEQPVNTVVKQELETLSARTALDRAIDHKVWKQYDVMPIINRDKQFVGALRYANLRNGLAHAKGKINEQVGQDPVSGISEVYGHTLITLFDVIGDVVQSDLKH